MLTWWIAAAAYTAVVTVACVRVIWNGTKVERALRRVAAFEHDVKARSRVVRLVGTPGTLVAIGQGTQVETYVNMRAAGFQLRHEDGTTYTVAEGANITLIDRTAVLANGQVSLPANHELMYLPEDEARDDGPLRTAGALAVLRGDSMLLFAPDAPIIASAQRAPRLAWPRVILMFGACIGVLVLSAIHAPASGWNALELFLLVMLLLDQTLLHGVLTMAACSHLRSPSAAK